MRFRIAFLLVVGLLASWLTLPHATAAFIQPDVFVKGGVGEGVHDATGLGQIKSVKAHKGDVLTLPFWNRNDGDTASKFTYKGCLGTSTIRVTWTDWTGGDVTGATVAGTFTTDPLGPGWSQAMLKLHVELKPSVLVGDRLRCTVLAKPTGGGTKDRAGYKIKVAA